MSSTCTVNLLSCSSPFDKTSESLMRDFLESFPAMVNLPPCKGFTNRKSCTVRVSFVNPCLWNDSKMTTPSMMEKFGRTSAYLRFVFWTTFWTTAWTVANWLIFNQFFSEKHFWCSIENKKEPNHSAHDCSRISVLGFYPDSGRTNPKTVRKGTREANGRSWLVADAVR